MQVVPKIAHFKIVIYCNLLCGVWPIVFENNPFLNKVYKTYSWFVFSFASVFVLTNYIKILVSCFTHFDIVVVTKLCTIGTAYTIGFLRVYSVKTDKAKELIKEVIAKEDIIYRSKDDGIVGIYNTCVKKNVSLNYFYMMLHYIDTVSYLYIIYPIFIPKDIYFDPVKNETISQIPLPVDSWIPFDAHKYHSVVFIWEEIATTICSLCNYGSDIFFYSYINYIIGQINILNYILSKFENYKNKIQNQVNCDEDRADLATIRLCVLEYQRILRYINKFNDTMRTVMLLDFLQSSLQLAMLALFVMNIPHLATKLAASLFGIISLGRLAIYYWYANEIMMKSFSLTDVLYNIKWYDKSPKFKHLLNMFIVRTNVRTGLQIGTLTTMSWQLFFGILKTAYSFLTFVLQTRGV